MLTHKLPENSSSDDREVRLTLDKCLSPTQAGGLSAAASPETAVALKQ